MSVRIRPTISDEAYKKLVHMTVQLSRDGSLVVLKESEVIERLINRGALDLESQEETQR